MSTLVVVIALVALLLGSARSWNRWGSRPPKPSHAIVSAVFAERDDKELRGSATSHEPALVVESIVAVLVVSLFSGQHGPLGRTKRRSR
ncbi:MAG TPA: hypothetical protein VGZ22_20730 [Isosphaeraceae bacterium]|nr:hypothetical protein [Isosphaeraceae bacterium]